MSVHSTWSTQATPLVALAGAVVLALGCYSIVYAALLFLLGDSPWGLPAYACLALTACLIVLRLCREQVRHRKVLAWSSRNGGFHVVGMSHLLDLERVWQGPGWVTLGLRAQAPSNRVFHLVVWKNTVPAPLWSELVLRIEAGRRCGESHQNKENA